MNVAGVTDCTRGWRRFWREQRVLLRRWCHIPVLMFWAQMINDLPHLHNPYRGFDLLKALQNKPPLLLSSDLFHLHSDHSHVLHHGIHDPTFHLAHWPPFITLQLYINQSSTDFFFFFSTNKRKSGLSW